MSDWQVGDLAVCIKKSQWRYSVARTIGDGPSFGDVCRVRKVGSFGADCVLWLDAWPGRGLDCSFGADAFRKVVRDKHEECEPEFITLLKRSKRKVGA